MGVGVNYNTGYKGVNKALTDYFTTATIACYLIPPVRSRAIFLTAESAKHAECLTKNLCGLSVLSGSIMVFGEAIGIIRQPNYGRGSEPCLLS
jgi:hypothetical protein